MSLSDSIEICEENIREQIHKAMNEFYGKYLVTPQCLVMSVHGYARLLKECETMKATREKLIMRLYMRMDLLMTVKDDMLFELI